MVVQVDIKVRYLSHSDDEAQEFHDQIGKLMSKVKVCGKCRADMSLISEVWATGQG